MQTEYYPKMIQLAVTIICFILCVFPTGSDAATTSLCAPSQYFNRHLLACIECSSCPINQIIRKPCLKNRDTICGPFKEFNRFHQTPEEGKFSLEYPQERKHKPRVKTLKHHKHHHHNHAADNTAIADPIPIATDISRANIVGMTSLRTSETQWRTLALGLIGILCLVSVCLLVFVITICYLRFRRISEEKIDYYSGVLRQEDTYVQIEPWLSEEYISSKGRSPTERGKSCFYSGNQLTTGSCVPTNQTTQHTSAMVLGPFVMDDTEYECNALPDLKDSSLDLENTNCSTNDNEDNSFEVST